MTRINLFQTNSVQKLPAHTSSVAWGKTETQNQAGIFVFAAALIICSLTVGCSSEKPKTEASMATPQVAQNAAPTPVSAAPSPTITQPVATPVPRKIVRRAPATVTYSDSNTGVSFRYPRKYLLKTGDKADEAVSSTFVPMNFPQTGGVTVATVQIPEGAYPKSDLVSAMFDVSVNKSLTAEQCGEFLTLQENSANREPAEDPGKDSGKDSGANAAPLAESAKSLSTTTDSTPPESTKSDSGKPVSTNASAKIDSPKETDAKQQTPVSTSKLLLGDMELKSSEILSGSESKKEDAKYYHGFENGACYEFALKVATTGTEPDEGGKPVDREEIFKHLEKILATVKINPVKTNPVEAEKQTAASPASASPTPAAQ